ncbi:Nucleoside-diphosphate-sugar epimerase [Cohaesibacter sp. ES.047]|nr:Nucleoside-diphosphate-sugar epimerase [Cohaesibacter sp. ES.047]
MVRNLEKSQAASSTPIEWIRGDALVLDDVMRAADGVSVIVHAVNPPGYQNWDKLVMPMLENSIAAARSVGGARLVLQGTIYNFDAASHGVIDEMTEQDGNSRKGRIRVEMERALRAVSAEVPVLILRAGDFFGPGAGSSWFSQAMVARGKRLKRIVNPAIRAGHSWAYLPDLGEAFAMLLDREAELLPFEVVHFEGIYDDTGLVMTGGIRQAVGRKLPVWSMPWWLFRLLAPFGGFPREVAEIIPHWKYPLRLDNHRLLTLLGAEPRTEPFDAIRAALSDLGCS